MDAKKPFPCLMVRRSDDGTPTCGVEEVTVEQLPPGEVLVEVACSSLNYKDALATRAHPGIVKSLPHIPGIDCAGVVAASDSPEYAVGDAVLVTGYELGAPRWGGLSAYTRVPAEWVVPMPPGWTAEEAMTYGTAGFTAAQCVMAIARHGIEPVDGEIVVTGATGGVGSVAVALLAKLGYRVTAVTGKVHQQQLLAELGASRVIGRSEVDDKSDRPLLKSLWAAAVDTVGGNILATVVRQMQHRGCVTACGLVAGEDVPLTVHPFILRGVTLAGIDSAKCPREPRMEVWQRLSGPWRLDCIQRLRRDITLREAPESISEMLKGKAVGRTVVWARV